MPSMASSIPGTSPPHARGDPKCNIESGSPTSGELQFVNLFGTPKHSKQKLKVVRSHVMRRFRRQKSERPSEKRRALAPAPNRTRNQPPVGRMKDAAISTPDSDISSIVHPHPAAMRSKDDSTTSQESRDGGEDSSSADGGVLTTTPTPHAPIQMSSPVIYISFGYSDPFDAFPSKLTPRFHQLLQFTIHQKVRTSVHEDPVHSFSSGIGSNASLLYTTLSYASAVMGRGRPTEVFESEQYLQQAVSLINETLKASGESILGIEDSTIAAVACLSNMENLTGDGSKAMIHIRGLKAMVEAKGGLDALGMNGVLCRQVLWADVCNATRWNYAPIFPPVYFPYLAPLSTHLPASAPNHIIIPSEAMQKTVMLTNACTLLPLLKELHELALFLDSTNQKDLEILHTIAYADRSYLVEHSVLSLISSHNTHYFRPSSGPSNEYLFLEILYQALLLYIYTNIRLTPVGSSLRGTLVSRIYHLVSSLSDSVLRDLVSIYPQEMVWIFFLVASTAIEEEEQAYFKRTLMPICEFRGLQHWDDVKEDLRRFLWIIGECLWRYREIWGRIVISRDEA